MDILDAVDSLDDVLKLKCYKAIAAVQRTLDLYGPDGTAFSFNGGKDSTVLLHIIRAAFAQRCRAAAADAASNASSSNEAAANGAVSGDARPAPGNAAEPDALQRLQLADGACRHQPGGCGGMRTFVFERDDDFHEIRDFVAAMDRQYGLDVEMLTGDFKAGLTQLVTSGGVRAIILGTRRGDPNAEGQEFFCPSSVGWPPFMRVNPVLEWTYADVWAFLRGTAAPYCALYDRGYTSVGGTNNTAPNSALRKEDGSFCPAHALADGRMERAGRAGRADLARPSTGHALTKSAGIVVVGDEILAAKVEDVNTAFLCSELRAIGWHVKKVVVIGDDVAAIAATVHDLSQEMDLVITAGGVGPTPDDVTLKGVAEAFGLRLSRDPETEQRLRAYFGEHLTAAHLKLAEMPEGECELIDHKFKDGRVSPFSLPRCRNVYVLPGVPDLLRQKWRTLKDHLMRGGNTSTPWQSIVLRLSLNDETAITPTLQQLNSSMHDMLSVGSYPVTGQPDGVGIVLSLEGKDAGALGRARDFLVRELPPGAIASEEANSPRYSAAEPRSEFSQQ